MYEKKGILHTNFNHEEFAEAVKKCDHAWLITYDDCPAIRKIFEFAHVHTWELQYGMNNYKQSKAEKEREFFIANYQLPF